MEKKDYNNEDEPLMELSEADAETFGVLFFGSTDEIREYWDSSDDPFFKSTKKAMQRCIDENLTGPAVIEAIQESVLDYYNQTKDKTAFAVLKALNAAAPGIQSDFEEGNLG